jgi:hypothetical protein
VQVCFNAYGSVLPIVFRRYDAVTLMYYEGRVLPDLVLSVYADSCTASIIVAETYKMFKSTIPQVLVWCLFPL